MQTSTQRPALYRFSWFIVFFTLLVIVWGAWVRISGSGAGCGDHWPLCHGEVIPSSSSSRTWVEFSHRLSTALYGILVFVQAVLIFRSFPKKHPARFWILGVLLFTLTEALIGAKLVVSELVDQSTDLARLVVMPLHLVNTLVLLFIAVMTAESVRNGDVAKRSIAPRVFVPLVVLVVSFLLIATSGAIAALGSHLSPSSSLFEGFEKDLHAGSHVAVRYRILHPILALVLSILVMGVVSRMATLCKDTIGEGWWKRFTVLFAAALGFGMLTLVLLAPVWMKLAHLTIACALWVVLSVAVFHTVRPGASHST